MEDPRSLARHLAELLFGNEERSAQALGIVSERWREVMGLALEWKILPQAAEKLQGSLPVEAVPWLRRELVRTYGETARRAAKALEAIRALEAAGIPVVVFKGMASMATLYADPRQRAIQDADLLVPAGEMTRAVECLEAAGFARQNPGELSDYTQFVDHAPGFAGNKAVALAAEGGEIDLHWELNGSGLTVEEILARAGRAELLGASIPVPDAGDALLLTIRHSVRENLAVEKIARDLLDVRLRCARMAGNVAAAVERILGAGSEVAALAVLGVLESWGQGPEARMAEALRARASAQARRSAERLVELFEYQLEHGALGKDVFYLVHSRPLRQIARGLGSGWRNYRRQMKALEETLSDERDWTERMAALARALPGPRAMKLARELARVKYGTD